MRFEAPETWRIRQLGALKGLAPDEAKAELERVDHARTELRRSYARQDTDSQAFDLTVDCSSFSIDEVAALVLAVLRGRGLLRADGSSRA